MTLRRTRRQPPTITDVPSPIEVPDAPLPAANYSAEPGYSAESISTASAEPAEAVLSNVELPPEPPAVHVSIRQRRLRPRFNSGVLLLIALLVIAGIFGGLAARRVLPAFVLNGWSLVIVLFSAIWFLRALGRRSGAALLGSTTLFGLSASLALAASGSLPFSQTWLGLTGIAVGIGTLLRGLLWRV